MTGQDIVNKARSFSTGYKYWYGGKRQIATKQLADTLRAQNPSVWTEAYYKRALKDINGKNRVCDCSGLVCAAYGIPDIGSGQIREKYKVWTGKPKPGMIAWKKGHIAIISDYDGHIIEMRDQSHDYQDTRYRKEAGLMTLLYDPEVDYDWVYGTGWHKDENGWWYATGTHKGEYVKSQFYVIYNRMFYFDENGYIKTGWFKVNGDWYWSDENGLWHERDDRKGVFEPWILY